MKNYPGISSNSKEVKPGFIFVAIRGNSYNGEQFISEAIQKGAKKIVVANDFNGEIPVELEIEKVANTRKYLALSAAQFYNSQPENIVAVTGTNGKTSTAFFFMQICELLGLKSAAMGSLGTISNIVQYLHTNALNLPNPVELHKILKELNAFGITHVAMEAPSQGLDQYRSDGVNIKAAAFTNLTQDHLDYHQNMDEYFEAKLRLFTELLPVDGYAVLNADINEYNKIIDAIKTAKLKVLSYGKSGNFIKLIADHRTSAVIEIEGKLYETVYNLAGNFQIYNLMAAIGLAMAVGLKADDIIKRVPQIIAAPGRMQKVTDYNRAPIFVDYSHTPDALEKAILSLKPNCQGKLHVIFGCGGDRDPTKRPIMGDIAAKNADVVYVTDDNPRTEDPQIIRRQILAACPNAYEEGSRAKCIELAIQNLEPGDVLLIAGKGHEDYQIIGTTKHHFSDVEEVIKVVNAYSQLI